MLHVSLDVYARAENQSLKLFSSNTITRGLDGGHLSDNILTSAAEAAVRQKQHAGKYKFYIILHKSIRSSTAKVLAIKRD